jgi:transcriptional regulator with XRE-family HTH domain
LTADRRQRHIDTVRANLTRTVVQAIAKTPGSMRSLAEEAGVSPALLTRLVTGSRAATPAVALKLATAFETWGASCAQAVQQLRAAARQVPTPRTGRTR